MKTTSIHYADDTITKSPSELLETEIQSEVNEMQRWLENY